MLLAMILVALVRIRLAAAPLERDEGEYAYAGQLILRGVPPYQLAYNMKFPGTYYAYALILAVFGETARGIHLGLLVVDAATTFLLFLLGRRLIGAFGPRLARPRSPFSRSTAGRSGSSPTRRTSSSCRLSAGFWCCFARVTRSVGFRFGWRAGS